MFRIDPTRIQRGEYYSAWVSAVHKAYQKTDPKCKRAGISQLWRTPVTKYKERTRKGILQRKVNLEVVYCCPSDETIMDYNPDYGFNFDDLEVLQAVADGEAFCPLLLLGDGLVSPTGMFVEFSRGTSKKCDVNNDGRVDKSDVETAKVMAMDYTGDGVVDLDDFYYLVDVVFGEKDCPYQQFCDMDGDRGQPDTTDLAIFLSHISQ